MLKNNDDLLIKNAALKKHVALLKRRLHASNMNVAMLKEGSIDALVMQSSEALKVFTEISADRPYRLLIEQMNEGAVLLNEKSIILYCNKRFAEMVNQPLQQVMGAAITDFISNPEDIISEKLFAGLRHMINKEIFLNPLSKMLLPVLVSAAGLKIDDRKMISLIFTDLTTINNKKELLRIASESLLQKNSELERANKDLICFTYVSSHDLQEPLRKIQNFVSFLLNEEKALTDKGKNYLQRTNETAAQMRELIDDMLAYSRSKDQERVYEKIKLNQLIDEVKDDFGEIIKIKKAVIKASNLCETNILRFQFKQLLHNLFSNSLKFARPGVSSRISIKSRIVKASNLHIKELSDKGNVCHIIYTDNGIGFDPVYNERIFEVFQRLHSHEEYKGTGMGLAICKRVLENHNGAITAKGELNKGARFDIYLPA